MVIEVADEHEGEKKRRERKRAWGLWEKREQGKESAPCDGQHVGSDSEDSQNDEAGVLNDGRDRHTADGMCTYKRQVARQHHAPVASCPHAAQSVQSLGPIVRWASGVTLGTQHTRVTVSGYANRTTLEYNCCG